MNPMTGCGSIGKKVGGLAVGKIAGQLMRYSGLPRADVSAKGVLLHTNFRNDVPAGLYIAGPLLCKHKFLHQNRLGYTLVCSREIHKILCISMSLPAAMGYWCRSYSR